MTFSFVINLASFVYAKRTDKNGGGGGV